MRTSNRQGTIKILSTKRLNKAKTNINQVKAASPKIIIKETTPTTLCTKTKQNSMSYLPYPLSPIDKKKSYSSAFNISDVIVSTELSGKIDTSKWNNQANIVTPDFKRAKSLYSSENKQHDPLEYP